MLASLERRPLEYDANECRPKFLMDRVEMSVTCDMAFDVSRRECMGSFQHTPANP